MDLTGGAFADIMETLFTGFFKGEGQMRRLICKARAQREEFPVGCKDEDSCTVGTESGKVDLRKADALDDYEKRLQEQKLQSLHLSKK